MHHRPTDLSEIVIGLPYGKCIWRAAHAAAAATHDATTVSRGNRRCCHVALVLPGARSVRGVPTLHADADADFNAHPNSLTLCSRRRRQFSSVETRRLSPRPSRYLSLTRTALGGLEPRLTHSQADIIISQPPFLLLLLSSLPGRGQSSVGRREVKSPPQIEIGSVAFAVCLPRRQSRCEYERGGTTTRS